MSLWNRIKNTIIEAIDTVLEGLERDTTRLMNPPRPKHWYDDFLPARDVGPIPAASDQIMLGRLCSKCRKLLTRFCNNIDTVIQNPRRWFRHHVNAIALERSSEAGCHLCTIIWHDFVDRNFNLTHESLRSQRVREAKNRSKHGKILVGFVDFDREYELSGLMFSNRDIWPVGCHIPLLTTETSPKITAEANLGSGCSSERWDASHLLKSTCSASNSSLELASMWIDDCVKNHASCRVGSTARLPSRLLHLSQGQGNVEGPRTVRLVSTNNLPATDTVQYAVLSYCWGGQASFTLTTTTKETLEIGVDIDKLPKTIKNAIQVTQFLGFRWLWVDSLCIIQDSLNDWSQEAARMCDVYQGSYFCIAALDSLSSIEQLGIASQPNRSNCSWQKAQSINGRSQGSGYGTKKALEQEANHSTLVLGSTSIAVYQLVRIDELPEKFQSIDPIDKRGTTDPAKG